MPKVEKEKFVKVYRHIMERDDYLEEPFDHVHAWIDLLLLANEEDQVILLRCGEEILVGRGQLCRTIIWLADRWKWSRSKVRRYLSELEKNMQICIYKQGSSNVITITNYEKYQGVSSKRRIAETKAKQSLREKNEALLATLDPEKDNYGRFLKWIQEFAKELIFDRMEMPSRQLFEYLRNKYGPIKMRDVIADMVNQPKLTRNYVMLGTTMKNWLIRRYG